MRWCFVANAGDSARLAQQTRKLDKKVPLIAAEWASTDQLLELGGNSVDSMAVVQQFNADDPSPHFTDFRQRYVKRFGREPAWQRAGARCSRASDRFTDPTQQRPAAQKALIELRPFRGCGKNPFRRLWRYAAWRRHRHHPERPLRPPAAMMVPAGISAPRSPLLLAAASAIALLIAFALLLAYYQPRLAARRAATWAPRAATWRVVRRQCCRSCRGSWNSSPGPWLTVPARRDQRQLQQLVSQGAFSAVYHLAADGRIAQAAIASNGGKRVGELIGNDLSNDRLRRAVMQQLNTVWSDKHLSPVSRRLTVAIGAWTGSDVLIGEIPLTYILETITESSSPSAWAIWVTDGYGDIVPTPSTAPGWAWSDLASQPVFTQAQGGRPAISTGTFEGQPYDMAASRSGRMNWYFIVRSPAGLNSPNCKLRLNLRVTALIS